MRQRREASGQGWVSGRDFRAPTCDGGPEISNITPRISELRKLHQIVTEERGPEGIARYRLGWDLGDEGVPIKQLVDDAREAARGDLDEPARLFDPPAPAPLNAALTDWDQDAA
jgi:hypothetical protein